MSNLIFLDTNILLYSISGLPKELRKRDIARRLIDEEDVALSVQVLQEFYVQATRPSRPDAIAPDLAKQFVDLWSDLPIQDITLTIMNAALSIQVRHRFSYWDCAIIAAAQAMECTTLYSEDMDDGRQIGSLRIVNPFKEE
ncbi:PIN domain-containing protein [Flavisphingomonas formosensis]|uniref:PIN domain-containing protein n=1 Tax=Flavisphingomonas formosensis TaxID=861534 RepID=UPI0018DF3C2C|nr:PIN domain-containing protein [Sphingomonas formosensis]